MSGAIDPSIKTISPMGFGEISVPIGVDFVNIIPAGYSIDPVSITPDVVTSIPPGFTFYNVSLNGTQIVFQAQAPNIAGTYLLELSPRLTGASPEPFLPRSIRVNVGQR